MQVGAKPVKSALAEAIHSPHRQCSTIQLPVRPDRFSDHTPVQCDGSYGEDPTYRVPLVWCGWLIVAILRFFGSDNLPSNNHSDRLLQLAQQRFPHSQWLSQNPGTACSTSVRSQFAVVIALPVVPDQTSETCRFETYSSRLKESNAGNGNRLECFWCPWTCFPLSSLCCQSQATSLRVTLERGGLPCGSDLERTLQQSFYRLVYNILGDV